MPPKVYDANLDYPIAENPAQNPNYEGPSIPMGLRAKCLDHLKSKPYNCPYIRRVEARDRRPAG